MRRSADARKQKQVVRQTIENLARVRIICDRVIPKSAAQVPDIHLLHHLRQAEARKACRRQVNWSARRLKQVKDGEGIGGRVECEDLLRGKRPGESKEEHSHRGGMLVKRSRGSRQRRTSQLLLPCWYTLSNWRVRTLSLGEICSQTMGRPEFFTSRRCTTHEFNCQNMRTKTHDQALDMCVWQYSGVLEPHVCFCISCFPNKTTTKSKQCVVFDLPVPEGCRRVEIFTRRARNYVFF